MRNCRAAGAAAVGASAVPVNTRVRVPWVKASRAMASIRAASGAGMAADGGDRAAEGLPRRLSGGGGDHSSGGASERRGRYQR